MARDRFALRNLRSEAIAAARRDPRYAHPVAVRQRYIRAYVSALPVDPDLGSHRWLSQERHSSRFDLSRSLITSRLRLGIELYHRRVCQHLRSQSSFIRSSSSRSSAGTVHNGHNACSNIIPAINDRWHKEIDVQSLGPRNTISISETDRTMRLDSSHLIRHQPSTNH
jgi:hypothetical protein